MAVQPRILDLFCGVGGASEGYSRAGFEVVGVDLADQPRYPGPFVRHDALALDLRFVRSFDAVHASPPCQFATALRHAPGGKVHPNLIPATRDLLQRSGLPYVIENVEGARDHLREPVRLCGTMFGLGAQGCELHRHRLFEANFPIPARQCLHGGLPVIGVYGGHARKRAKRHGGRGTRDAWVGGHRAAASEAMGIGWATLAEISEAIPPDFTEYVGRALLAHLQQRKAAA